jgi:hypothetical protein
MSEMVERVARAICADRAEPWLGLSEDDRRSYCETARAAIDAMRQPTREMVAAAERRDDPGSSVFEEPFVAIPHDEAWEIMIDAALK